jgi:hypothetical protein
LRSRQWLIARRPSSYRQCLTPPRAVEAGALQRLARTGTRG